MEKKKWYKSQTLWLAIAQGVAGVLVVVMSQYPEVGELILLKSALDIYIRFSTTQPVKI